MPSRVLLVTGRQYGTWMTGDPRKESAPPGSERDATWPARWPALLGLLLVSLAIGVHANALHGPFVFDDLPAIVDNPNIESLTPLSRALGAPPATGASGRPLVALSLAVNYAFGGREVLGYHVFNLLVHWLVGLTVFGLVRRVASRSPPRGWLHPNFLATAVALLWCVHPLHTAALHHVIYRGEALVALFYCLTLYCAVRGFESPAPGGWFAASIAACALGAASKEVIVSAPLVVLLYDRCFVSWTFGRALRSHRALHFGLVATWLLLAWIVSLGDRGESVGFGLAGLDPLTSLRTQAGVLAHYAWLSVWPRALAFDYGDWPAARDWSEVALPAAVVTGVLVFGLVGLARRRMAGFLIVAIFLVLAPTSSFIALAGAWVGEHRMYLPLVAVACLAVPGLGRLLESGVARHRTRGLLFSALIALAVVASAVTTFDRNRAFASSVSLWSDAVARRPGNARAWNSYGVALAAAGREQEAREAYARTLALEPDHLKARINLGNLELRAGDLVAARASYERAVKVDPEAAEALQALGATALALGDAATAVQHLRRALELGLPPALAAPAAQNLAWVLATASDPALRDGREALRLATTLGEELGPKPRVLDVLAAAYAEVGRFDEAIDTARRALESAGASGQGRTLARIRAHLASYERHEPWREGS